MKFIGEGQPKVFPVQLEINSDELAALTALLGRSSSSTFVAAGAATSIAAKAYDLFTGFKDVCGAAGVDWRTLYDLTDE